MKGENEKLDSDLRSAVLCASPERNSLRSGSNIQEEAHQSAAGVQTTAGEKTHYFAIPSVVAVSGI